MHPTPKEAQRGPSVWVARGALVAPIVLSAGVWVLATQPFVSSDWGGPMELVLFVAVPMAYALAGNALSATPFKRYATTAFVLVPGSLILNLLFLFAFCAR